MERSCGWNTLGCCKAKEQRTKDVSRRKTPLFVYSFPDDSLQYFHLRMSLFLQRQPRVEPRVRKGNAVCLGQQKST